MSRCHNFVGIFLSGSCLVALVSAQCEAEIAACAADGTCSTCRHYGTRCTVPDSDRSAWSADSDSEGGCGDPDLWDYGGLNHDGSMPSFDRNGAPGQQVSTNCEHSRTLCLCMSGYSKPVMRALQSPTLCSVQ